MLGGGGKSTKIAAENGTAFTYAHFIKPDSTGKEIVADISKALSTFYFS